MQTRERKQFKDQTKVNLVIAQRHQQFPEVRAGGNSSHLGHLAQCLFGDRRTWKTPSTWGPLWWPESHWADEMGAGQGGAPAELPSATPSETSGTS